MRSDGRRFRDRTGHSLATVNRMDEFRGIVFRDGLTGRRAALTGGPDIWELMATIKSAKTRGEEASAATAELLNLTIPKSEPQSATTAPSSKEIDRRISLNTKDADEAEEAWKRERAALA